MEAADLHRRGFAERRVGREARTIAAAGFDAVEIFEADLLSFHGTPRTRALPPIAPRSKWLGVESVEFAVGEREPTILRACLPRSASARLVSANRRR
jgi:hypothetical protein